MGRVQYTNIAKKHSARGIDTYSPNSNIPDGFAANLVNVDTSASGKLETRKGFQSAAGFVPIRITSVTHSGTSITFEIDNSQAVSLNDIGNGPLLVFGKITAASAGAGDWTTANQLHWYPNLVIDNKTAYTVGSNTIVKTEAEHGIASEYLAVGWAQSLSATDSSNQLQALDSISIDTATHAITLGYTATVAGDAFIWYKEISALTGTRYVSTVAAQTTVSISAATHGLTNFNIQTWCFDESTPGTFIQQNPASVTISLTGTVVLTFATAFTGDIVLVAVPIANAYSDSAPAPGTYQFEITAPTTPYIFIQGYYYDAGTSTWNQVTPANVEYNATTDKVLIDYVLAGPTEAVEFYYDFGQAISNKITVTDTTATSESYTEAAPQLTLWGVDHDGIYLDSDLRGGHVNHIDSYRKVAESRLIAGLGGNLFAERLDSEVGDTYGMDSYGTLIRTRAAGGDQYLHPLFDTTGSTAQRTRGLVTDASIESYRAVVTAAAYVSSGVADFTLSFTSKTGSVDLTSVSIQDYLTVSGMAHSEHNGSWAILSVQSDSATETVLRVTNTAITSTRFNELAAAGRAGVFTDRFETTGPTHPFIPGDQIISTGIDEDLTIEFYATDTSTADIIYVEGVTTAVVLPNGIQVTGLRTTDLIPCTDVENLVRGDMLTVTDLVRKTRVLEVNAQADISATLSSTGGVATVTAASAHYLDIGRKVLITGGGNDAATGEFTVTGVTSATVFTFALATTIAGPLTVNLVGNTFRIDETLAVQDGLEQTEFTVESRWIPVEAPTTTGDLPVKTYIRHLDTSDYADHPTLRSTIVNDSMYFTNQEDEVYKFDGESIFRAGLPQWNPGLFAQVDTSVASILKGYTVAYTASSGTSYSFDLDAAVFSAGDRIFDDGTDAIFTVVRTEIVPGTPDIYRTFVLGDSVASISGTGNLTLVKRYRYYFRLNYIDANNNIVTSNVAQSNDFVVELAASGQIKLRLVGLPTLDNYDYDYLEVEVYRTAANQANPFYFVSRQIMSFNNANGYIDIVDTKDDSLLVDFDPVNTGLLGQELGVGWDQPLRAKYITSANGMLLLGNVRDYPAIALSLQKRAGAASVTAANLDNFKVLLRKDSTDASTTTNMVDRARYEFIADTPLLLVNQTVAKTFTVIAVDNVVPIVAHGYLTGDTVDLTTDGTLPTGLTAGRYYVIRLTADTLSLATTTTLAFAGTVVPFTNGTGSGTHTLTAAMNITNNGNDTFTLVLPAHGAVAGNWVYLFHADTGTNNDLQFAGWWQVSSVTTNTIIIKSELATTYVPSADDVNRAVFASAKVDIPVWIGEDGNMNQRDANFASSVEGVAAVRLASAINATQRVTDITISGQTTFVPWITALAGNSFGLGQIVLRQPTATATFPEAVLDAVSATSSYTWFGNQIERVGGSSDAVVGSIRRFPSRVILSYPQFPEIFNSPSGGEAGPKVLDINSADGQEVTALVNFFGESASGSANLKEVVLVFKEQSVYLLDPLTTEYQKLDTNGQGCTAPFSVAPTKSGVMFANESGVYRINRDLSMTWVGKNLEGLWRDSVNRGQLSEATGHQYRYGRKYKLSVPVGSDNYNSQVFVYNHDQEGVGQELGAWTTYTNHDVTGWANLADEAYWASQRGDVFILRNTNLAQDYRDDAEEIAEQIIELKAEDFDVTGVRKIVSNVITDLELPITDIGTLTIESRASRTGAYASAGDVTILRTSTEAATFRASPANRKANYFQVKYRHSDIDCAIVLTGVTYRVGQGTVKGIKEVADY